MTRPTERCPFNGVDCEYIPLAHQAVTDRAAIVAETEARIVAWLRADAGKTADDLRRLHRGKKLTPSQTIEWETLIQLKLGIADAIEAGEYKEPTP